MNFSQQSATPPRLPWLEWRAGDRVTLLYRENGNLQEVAGELIETSLHGVVVRSRRGDVRVHASQMIVGRKVEAPK